MPSPTRICGLGEAYTLYCKNPASNYCYVNDVYINQGESPAYDNKVQNADFSYGSDKWDASGSDQSSAVTFTNGRVSIAGQYDKRNRIFQSIPSLSGVAGDTIVFSASVSATGLPNSDDGSGTATATAVTLVVNYTDGSAAYPTVYAEPDPSGDWYAISGAFEAQKAFNSVKIYLKHDYSVNTALFDNIWVAKETFGTSYTVDYNGNVTAVTGRNGETAQNTYNSMGQPLTEVDALGNTTTYTYGKGATGSLSQNNNQLLESKTPMGQTTKYTYDIYGNVTGARTGATGFTSSTAISQYINGGETVYGNYGTVVTAEKDAFGNTVQYTNNSATLRTTKATSPNGTSASYEYASNLISGVADSNGQTGPLSARYVNDKDGNLISYMHYGYEKGALSTIMRDSFGYNFSELETIDGNAPNGALSQQKTSVYMYDANGNLTQQTLSAQYYDKRGLPMQLQYGNYVALPTAARYTSASHRYTTAYDTLGRLKEESFGSTRSQNVQNKRQYYYDREGNLFKTVENNRLTGEKITNNFFYDLAGRLKIRQIKNADQSLFFSYTYDKLSRVSSYMIFTEDGSWDYDAETKNSYNANGQITQETNATVPHVEFYYDTYGRFNFTAYGKSTQKMIFRSVRYATNSLSGKAQQTSRIQQVNMRYAQQNQSLAPDDQILYTYIWAILRKYRAIGATA